MCGGAGKFHLGTLGTERSDDISLQLTPRSSLTNRCAGSVPANNTHAAIDAPRRQRIDIVLRHAVAARLPNVLPSSALTWTEP